MEVLEPVRGPPEQKVGGSNPLGRTRPPLTMAQIMSDLDRLHEIIDALPRRQVHAKTCVQLCAVPEEELTGRALAAWSSPPCRGR